MLRFEGAFMQDSYKPARPKLGRLLPDCFGVVSGQASLGWEAGCRVLVC